MKLLIDTCIFIDSFDPKSPNYPGSIELLELLRERGKLVTMPAHGWFEVQCALLRLANERRFVGPRIRGVMNYQIELIHIDKDFILKYAMADIPYIKAGDHIFIAVAKINDYELVTSDNRMYDISKSIGIKVYKPVEYIKKLQERIRE